MVLDFLAFDNFDFTRKIVKNKNLKITKAGMARRDRNNRKNRKARKARKIRKARKT